MLEIYCNGDSFTAGEELQDHLLSGFPGFNTTGSMYAKDVDKRWAASRWTRGEAYFGGRQKYIDAGKSVAWPAKLSQIDNNINVTNDAVGGSSITGIANRTLLNLYKNPKKYDFIFIQLTSPSRFEFYNSNLPELSFMKEKAMGWVETLPLEYEKQIAQGLLKLYKDADYSIKYLYSLCMLKNAIKGLTGITPIFLGSAKTFVDQVTTPLISDRRLYENENIQNLLQDSELLNMQPEDFMSTIQEENSFLYYPISHYEQRTHDLYASVVYNKYIK